MSKAAWMQKPRLSGCGGGTSCSHHQRGTVIALCLPATGTGHRCLLWVEGSLHLCMILQGYVPQGKETISPKGAQEWGVLGCGPRPITHQHGAPKKPLTPRSLRPVICATGIRKASASRAVRASVRRPQVTQSLINCHTCCAEAADVPGGEPANGTHLFSLWPVGKSLPGSLSLAF